MGGPIVRTGTTPAFWANWEKAFGKVTGGKKKSGKTKTVSKKPAKSMKTKKVVKPKKKRK
jgi:phage tail tape-measure protein